LPEVQQVLTDQFDGRPINEVNLSEWKAGGYLDWQARREMLAHTQELVEEAQDLKAAITGSLAEHLSVVVAGRYAELLNKWNGEVDERFMKQLKGLRLLSQDVATLRRGEVQAERVQLEKDKWRVEKEHVQAKALELCLAEAKQFPEVAATFQKAFDLLDEAEGIEVPSRRTDGEAEPRQQTRQE